ncbi:MAG: immunoglobulin-like domain-containing protein [Flavobacteriaceae bacterium]
MMKKKIVIALVILVAFSCAEDYNPPVPDTTAPEITIIGDNPQTITLPATYTELGATALDDIDGDISDNIEITGTANFLVPGMYQVTYSVSDAAGNATSAIREVTIVELATPDNPDTTAPEIAIIGSNPLTITVSNEYTELGAVAFDNTDGNITDSIEITSTVNVNVPGTYEVTYTVLDAAENATSVTREVTILAEPDTTAPEITIVGDNPLTIVQPNGYTELGATALDDTDGDITDNIEITGEVNVNVPETYEVTYTVLDAAGNATSAIREVIIQPEPDTTAPEITIVGDNPLTIKQYSEYTELGATALDDTDGDISNGIVITSTVNVDILGSYVVSYSVSDVAGNSTSVTREVIVEENDLSNGLVGKFDLDGFDLDGNVNDSSGFNNHGKIVKRTGDVTPAENRDGVANSAMSFSYSVEENDGGYIDVGDVDALTLTSSISISVWINPSGNQVAWDDIVSKWKAPGYYLALTPEGKLRWNVSNEIIDTDLPYTSDWVHIVATCDGARSELYINGVFEIGVDVSDPIAENSDEFRIGGAGGGGQFDGEIDDVYVYDRVLTYSEIQALYNN